MSPHRETLLAARSELANNDVGFICIALRCVESKFPHLAHVALALKERVQEELAPCGGLGEWLHYQGIDATFNQRQLARLAWIDRMLEDYP